MSKAFDQKNLVVGALWISFLTSTPIFDTCAMFMQIRLDAYIPSDRSSGHQVQNFFLDTPDGEQLYAWHVLPLALYAARQDELSAATATNSTKELALRLLQEDPESRVVINCMLFEIRIHLLIC